MRLAVAAAALLLLSAAPARAAVVSSAEGIPVCGQTCVGSGDPGTPHDIVVTISAAPGEVNHLVVDDRAGEIVVTDSGTPPVAGVGCRAVAGAVQCADGPANGDDLEATLGDGDDTLDARGFPGRVSVDAGPGDDRVLGASASENVLTGGPGRDVLTGGSARDRFLDGDGATPSHDVVDGGAGEDLVSYAGRRDTVTAVLAGPSEGPPEDALTGVEDLTGGDSGDTLIGDGGRNVIDGGPGGDVLDGAGGDDTLVGGSASDDMRGGAGDDQLVSADGTADRVDCGAGRDTVTSPSVRGLRGPDPTDVLIGCERTGLNPRRGHPGDALVADLSPISRTRRAVVLRRPCRSCAATVRLRANGREVGRARVRAGRGPVRIVLRRPVGHFLAVRWDVRAAGGRRYDAGVTFLV